MGDYFLMQRFLDDANAYGVDVRTAMANFYQRRQPVPRPMAVRIDAWPQHGSFEHMTPICPILLPMGYIKDVNVYLTEADVIIIAHTFINKYRLDEFCVDISDIYDASDTFIQFYARFYNHR
jgi:hypothetical protein